MPYFSRYDTNIEEQKIIKLSRKYAKKLILYACTSDYPVRRVYVFKIDKLKKNKKISAVGFSGHHQGISADVAAALWVQNG